jgi:hypothetical protein
MIKANELRIGNWVNVQDQSVQLSFIDNEDNEEFEPIPLTPEIVEKCGFVNKAVHEFWMSKQATHLWANVAYSMTGHVLLKDTIHSGSVRITNIKFLHQLQNLYFALTGEELEIKM